MRLSVPPRIFLVTVTRWTCCWYQDVIVMHAITGSPHSFPVSPSLGLLRLFELSVGAYSHPRSRDQLPSGSSWDEHTSINLGSSPRFENSMNDPSYPRWCTSLFHGPRWCVINTYGEVLVAGCMLWLNWFCVPKRLLENIRPSSDLGCLVAVEVCTV